MNFLPKNIDPALIEAYQKTTFRVLKPLVDLKIGQGHPHFDEFLIDNNIYTWAFVTAYNPFSQALSETENETRQQSLKEILQKEGLLYCEAIGIPENTDWQPEKSVLIMGISLQRAVTLAQDFEQNAIVFGEFNQKAELVWCLKE